MVGHEPGWRGGALGGAYDDVAGYPGAGVGVDPERRHGGLRQAGRRWRRKRWPREEEDGSMRPSSHVLTPPSCTTPSPPVLDRAQDARRNARPSDTRWPQAFELCRWSATEIPPPWRDRRKWSPQGS